MNKDRQTLLMTVRNGIGCLFLLLVYAGEAHAQSSAQITLPQGTVTAGDSFDVPIKLDRPAPCDTLAVVDFMLSGGDHFSALANVHTGETTPTLKATLAKDLRAGDYQTLRAYLNPCPGYQSLKEFKVPVLTMSVKPFLDSIVYPRSADISLSLTQKQFLDTKIAELDGLDSKLTTALEGHSADTDTLRNFLAQIVHSSEDALTVTENQYRNEIMKSQGEPPAFFAEFHYRYQALLIELKAPIAGVARASSHQRAMLLYVQISKRAPAAQPTNPRNPSRVLPIAATAVREAMKDNRLAYKYVKDTGRITFDIQLTSTPIGARIYYKKLIDDNYKDYSSPTDVRATLELATWDFMFHKDGCKDDVKREIDPYQDTDPSLPVVFTNCRK